MPTNETHKLKTIADLFRVVSVDNVESLLVDLRGLLLNVLMTKTLAAAATPNEKIDLFKGVVITWTDDNVNRQSIMIPKKKGSDGCLEFRTTGPVDI